MQLDTRIRKILNIVQTEFPLTIEPFADLANRLDISVEQVIQDITRLKKARIIRLIGPVIDPVSLGFNTTLVAMRVADTNLEKAEQVIAGHPGVSHGYERDHWFNVWFTLALPPLSDIETELQQLTLSAGAEIAYSLPAVKIFKIGAYFDMDENGESMSAVYRSHVLAGRVELSDSDRRIINVLQQDLSLEPMPFSKMAEKVDMDTEHFLAECRSLQERGAIRRFSASVNHKNAGFTANAMSCWVVPADAINTTGQKLASLKEVSHCYERKVNQYWHYNLFAMIHGHSREKCREIAEKVSVETGLTDFVLIYSTKEFKKTRIKYLA